MFADDDSGAIVAESVMIIALVTLLCGTILQLGVVIHTRNTMLDAASAGARYAALADRSLVDGRNRAVALLHDSVPNTAHAQVIIHRTADRQRITVEISHRVPVIGFLTAPIPLTVTAQAYDLATQ